MQHLASHGCRRSRTGEFFQPSDNAARPIAELRSLEEVCPQALAAPALVLLFQLPIEFR